MTAPAPPPPRLFDRALLTARLDRAIRAGAAASGADFLLRRAAEDLAERVSLVKRAFADAADVGTPGPHAALALAAREGARTTLRLAPTLASLGEGGFTGAVGDLEHSALAPASLDLATSLLALHHANDLPGALIQIRAALRPDGLFVGALLGGDTLAELRQALTVAESDMTGGASPRVAPFADVRALGGLLQRAGFALPVVDADALVVRYPDMFALLRDLRAFGGANALVARSRQPARRELFARAAAVYAERFSDPDGRIRATFEILWISGWAPHASQPKPLKPGSAAMRLEDALNLSRQGEPAPDAD